MSNKNTEATFEADVKAELHRVFPGLIEGDITHQRSFTLRFGHHNVSINGATKNYALGRLDILVSIKGKPTAVFELKNTNTKINQDDVDQGISYARLTDPITPLTIISNGSKTEIYNTYTGEKLINSTVDEELINATINAGMKLAANRKADAISLLIGDDTDILSQIIKQISKTNFAPFIGGVSEFTKPISKDFSIPRSTSKKILEQTSENHLIALIGGAYSGKTNVLWQTYQLTNWTQQSVYYVDASNSYGAIQQLANYLSKEIRIPINKDRVRNWIINGFIAKDQHSLIIMFDNWSTDVHPDIQTEFLELLDLFRGTGNSVVIAVDKTTYRKLTVQKNRLTRNLIGHESTITELTRLSSNEFEGVNELMFNCSEHFLGPGAQYHPWFLQPRSLRILAGTAKEDVKDMPSVKPPAPGMSRAIEIPSIPGDFMFEMVKKIPTSIEFKGYLKVHVKCFLAELNISLSTRAQLSRYRTGAVTLKKLKTVFDESLIDNFIKQGLLLKEYIDESEVLIHPVLVEQVSARIPEEVVRIILQKCKSEDLSASYQELISICTKVAYGDLVGYEVIKQIGRLDPIVYGDLFNKLLLDKPEEDLISDGTEIMARIKNATVNIKFQGDFEDKLISNLLPWSIASHMMLHPMKAEGEDRDYHFYLSMMRDIGSYNGGLLFINQEFFDEPFHLVYQSVPKYGEVLSSEMGIVEPIVHAMRNAIREIPELMIDFTKRMINEESFHVIYRLNHAARHNYKGKDDKDNPFSDIYILTYAKLQEMLDEAFLEELGIDMKKLRNKHNDDAKLFDSIDE